MKKIQISKEILENLYIHKGLTTYEIADQLKCCQGTIWKRLKEFHIPPHIRLDLCPLKKEELSKYYLKEKLSTWAIERKFGYPRGTVHRKLTEFGIGTRNLAVSHIKYPRANFSGGLCEKAYIIGFAMGDLRVRKTYQNSETVHIDCGSTHKAQIDLIGELFKKYGRVWLGKPDKRGSTQIECFVNDSFDFLLLKRSLADVWIMRSRKTFAAFLAGFSDAEGCVSISRGMAYFSLGNYNSCLLKQIKEKLEDMGIICSKLHEGKGKGRIVFGKYKQNQNSWQLGVHRKTSLLNLFDLISPYVKHKEKQEAIMNARNNIRERNTKFGFRK